MPLGTVAILSSQSLLVCALAFLPTARKGNVFRTVCLFTGEGVGQPPSLEADSPRADI